MSSLKYGLNIKGKPKQSIAKGINLSKNRKQNPLQDDSEEDSNERLGLEVSHQAVINRELNLSHEKTSIKEKEMQNKALEANPNMYEYDELYDDLKRQEVYIKNIKDGVTADGTKKAKYMENLINNSNKRKSYLEQAKQRKMLKEREDEKELFGDKVFTKLNIRKSLLLSLTG
jgi:coiled-coil domain-containing protein 55